MVLLLGPSIFDKHMIHVVAVGAIVFEYNIIHVDAVVLSTFMRNYSNGQVQRATSIIKGLNYHVPRLPRPVSSGSKDKYTTIWTFRGIMLLRMEQAGMKSLPLGASP